MFAILTIIMMSSTRKRQSTLFSGPGAVKVRLVDKANRTHYVPLDNDTIRSITGQSRPSFVPHACPQCGKSFSNEQGLGGHLQQ